jgi:adenylylsulfate kinase
MKYNNHKKYSLFIGRWQPFHKGHKYLIDKALHEGKNVCIALRDTEISDENPYTLHQRKEMINRVFGDKIKIITIPDIESVNIGRNVGYEVNVIDTPKKIQRISGTEIRNGKNSHLPKEVESYIQSLRTTLWFTGLPCSGKTTLAKRLKEELDNRGYRTVHLDGDDVRKGLNKDLKFSDEDRLENLRRVAHVARLFNENNNFVVSSFVTPTNRMRNMVKKIIGSNIKLCYVKCSLKVCEQRDTKGLYKKARAGEIKDFTGISSPFEEPTTDLVIDTEYGDVEECVGGILKKIST